MKKQQKTVSSLNYKAATVVLLVVVMALGVMLVKKEEASPSVDSGRTPKSIVSDFADYSFDYIGLSETEAKAKAEVDGLTGRVVRRDGEGLLITADRSEKRLNFDIDRGRVVKVEAY